MKFTELVGQVRSWLEREQRVTYRTLKREFDLDDETFADLREELIEAKRVAVDENGKVLVWTGTGTENDMGKWGKGAAEVVSPQLSVLSPQPPAPSPQPPSAERRQLTVMFCDLVGSTALSTQLDPEDLRAVVRQYQQTCAEVIQRHDGYIAQYLGDGLLVYFGYPTAHEDDARRAVRTGLEIIQTLRDQVPSPLAGEGQGEGDSIVECGMPSVEKKSPPPSLPIPHSAFAIPQFQVRIGIHTGLVVIGDMGGSGRTEQLALGETPNIAARIQGLAEPNTVIISAATHRLVERQFESQPFGSHLLKGLATPIAVYHVQSERQISSHLAGKTTLTPLVGRKQEVGLLLDRWEQAKEGRGQVVLLSGEPGIGKSRLAYTLRAQVTAEGSLLYEARCSPYHQHSALYPLIEVLQRTLVFTRHDTDTEKVEKLDRTLALYNMQESLPLFTALLSLPTPSHYPPFTITPQKQKERTLQALLQVMMAQAERQATVSVWEDLHWADPSSLEFLSLLIDQLPTSKLLLVLTFRPEFTPPWKPRSHISQLVLNRLSKKQVEAMIEQATAGSNLSAEVIEQIRLKTDGVPLFVEELTKSVVEAVGGQGSGAGGRGGTSGARLAIPATLQEVLLARLDRLSTARQVAQLGATLGREFSHELLQAVTPLNETDLHTALERLVEAEILYQRGIGEQARYFFKHALIQDTAYQSLLKSTRQQYHQQIAHALEERFPDTKEHQPELLAHHYTEAALIEQAIPYWQRAGEAAVQRSAFIEATTDFTTGVALLQSLPETIKRTQGEVHLQILLGSVLMMAKGMSAPEVGAVLTRAYDLCQQLDDPVQLFHVIALLRSYRDVRGEARQALTHAEQLLQIAQQTQNSGFLLLAHVQLGVSYFVHGKLTIARENLTQEVALHDSHERRSLALFFGGIDLRVISLSFSSMCHWLLGYTDQALEKGRDALALARELASSSSVSTALIWTSWVHICRHEDQQAQELLAEALRLGTEYGIPTILGISRLLQARTLLYTEKKEEGLKHIQETLSFLDSMETRAQRSSFLAFQAEGHRELGQRGAGLSVITQALSYVEQSGERYYEPELYRLKGELVLQARVQGPESENPSPQPLTPSTQAAVEQEAEGYFLKALAIAQQQQAKSWELRASTSLARLWHQQGKSAEAHTLLSEVYTWFTEGFDTKDWQEAKGLLQELSH